MDLVVMLVTGGLMGWLASVVTANREMSLLGCVLVGVVGSVVGDWLTGLLGLPVQRLGGSLVASFLGTLLLVRLLRAVAGPRHFRPV